MSILEASSGVQVAPEFEALSQRARAGQVEVSTEISADDAELVLSFPNGRSKRAVRIYDIDDANSLLSISFEKFSFVGDYDAIVNYSTGELEARLAHVASRPSMMNLAWRIPGVEDLDPKPETLPGFSNRDSEGRLTTRGPKVWRLIVSKGDVEIEISPVSEPLRALAQTPMSFATSIKIRGLRLTTHESALEVLEQMAPSYLLDLDLKYQVGLSLARMRTPAIRIRRQRSRHEPSFPANRYAQEPLALYFYGRSASGMPLLEFLAYYQVLEFYFPAFGREDTTRRVKALLQDPRFDREDDNTINRLISISATVGKNFGPEREQLRTTIRACLDVDQLRDFVQQDDRTQDHFCRKNQNIGGLQPIKPQPGQPDLRDQIADRIYEIRCRVVHTKSDSTDSGVELLLPSSKEARALHPDVDLVRFLAEQVLINRAVPLRL